MSERVYVLSPNDPQQLDRLKHFAPESAEVVWVDATQPVAQQAVQLQDAVAVVAAPSVFPVELAQACPKLRLVQTVSAGTNMIDLVALGELGIKVANNGGGNAVAVSEHTIALMVSVYRKMHLQFQAVKNRQWAGDIRSTWGSDASGVKVGRFRIR